MSTIEAQRYWELAGNELGRIISSLGGTPLSATAAGEPALLCLGEHGAAIVTIRGNSFVVHRVRRGAGPISIRESGPMLAEFSERDCNIEIDVPGPRADRCQRTVASRPSGTPRRDLLGVGRLNAD